ncbi:MAG: Bug family tripartite tricarboxylate transporter substrate binding protein [Betaproteobacteria bacterium]
MKAILVSVLAGASLVFGAAAPAQDFPSKPIRIVVPFPPGGGVDVAARLLTNKMTERLGWQFVVENRPGGNGFIAATNVAKSAPDGYSLFMAHVGEFAINPALFPSIPYELERDFVPVTLVSDAPMVYFVNSQTPYNSLRDVVAAAKAKPGSIAYSSAGNGSLNHLAAEWLSQAAGVKLTHVPYKGGAAAAAAVAAGDVPFGVSSIPGVAPHIKSGRVKVLAVTTAKRSPFQPDWATPAELGVGDVNASFWTGLLAPKGTPPAVVEKIDQGVRQTLQDPDMRKRYADAGFEAVGASSSDFLARIKRDAARFKEVVQSAGIKSE